jgi:hypothetical protein
MAATVNRRRAAGDPRIQTKRSRNRTPLTPFAAYSHGGGNKRQGSHPIFSPADCAGFKSSHNAIAPKPPHLPEEIRRAASLSIITLRLTQRRRATFALAG